MIRQRTLKNVIRATGVGIHTGQKVYMTLRPAAVNTGIVFRRVDLEPAVDVPAFAIRNLGFKTFLSSLGNSTSTQDPVMQNRCCSPRIKSSLSTGAGVASTVSPTEFVATISSVSESLMTTVVPSRPVK